MMSLRRPQPRQAVQKDPPYSPGPAALQLPLDATTPVSFHEPIDLRDRDAVEVARNRVLQGARRHREPQGRCRGFVP